MAITIATYNVNSVRARLHILVPWLEKVGPDIVCLQETKVQDYEFPSSPLQEAGYNVIFKGQKSYNGVAILSRSEPSAVINGFNDGGPADESRLLVAEIGGITVVNTYVP
ncbi:endonuclease/exonuclease/phosphatase family protein, partial [Candidatus Bipolaricaulota bacterium]|nr:endonuclease/exonuclease/phosphatase family protein [Candidatus Bipolaricaulota bacterium]